MVLPPDMLNICPKEKIIIVRKRTGVLFKYTYTGARFTHKTVSESY